MIWAKYLGKQVWSRHDNLFYEESRIPIYNVETDLRDYYAILVPIPGHNPHKAPTIISLERLSDSESGWMQAVPPPSPYATLGDKMPQVISRYGSVVNSSMPSTWLHALKKAQVPRMVFQFGDKDITFKYLKHSLGRAVWQEL